MTSRESNLSLIAPVDDDAKTIRRELVELSTIDLLKADVVPITGRVRAAGTPKPALTREQSPASTIMGVAAFAAADTIAVAPKVIVEQAPPPAPAPESHWKSFEDIGLVPKPFTKKAQKLVVSSYRLLGFGILSLIVFVLLAYIATTAFYFLNHTWVTPVTVSANDDKVIALKGQLAMQQNERAKLMGDLDQADRSVAAEQAFQLAFARAIKRDLENRKAALDRAKQLSHAAASTRTQIRQTNDSYSSTTVDKMSQDYAAGLIDRQAMLAGKFQMAQISSANLSLAERQAEFDERASELAAETSSLDAILADKTQTAALSYDVLKIERDYDASKLQLAKDLDDRARLRASVARVDKIIDGIRQSNYLRALDDHATVALVPYTNLDDVKKGTKLYGCAASMLWCHEVGTVIEVLSGEVLVKHPHRDAMVRGQMVELQMSDAGAAQDDVLFLGGKPLAL
jgi:hypothetical protein